MHAGRGTLPLSNTKYNWVRSSEHQQSSASSYTGSNPGHGRTTEQEPTTLNPDGAAGSTKRKLIPVGNGETDPGSGRSQRLQVEVELA